jgi:hypothetical protein
MYNNFVTHLNVYCGVFTPCKNCNFETRYRDYATIDDAVFSPCRVARRTLLRSAEVNMLPLLGDKCKRLDCARVERGHVISAGPQ